MKRLRNIFFLLILFAIASLQTGCADGKQFSTTYHSHFFGIYKPKARRPTTPGGAFATGLRGADPFSRRKRGRGYNVAGDGYHTIIRHMRKQSSMGRPADSQGLFFKRKTRKRRRSPALEDKKIFGKYQRKAKKNHGKH